MRLYTFMNTLPKDMSGSVLQVFSPSEVLLAQTTIDTSDKDFVAILPTTLTNVKIDGCASFVAWPLGVTLGLQNITTIEFESATDCFVMR